MANQSHDLSKLNPVSAEVAAKIKLAAAIPPGFVLPDAVAASMAPALAIKPGVERWPVKTGTDPDVGDVGKNIVNGQDLGAGIVDTTVEELINIPRPRDMAPPQQDFPAFQQHRSEPVESTVWRLTADIIAVKIEADGDYHLVLQGDSGDTMVGEVPTPKSPFVKAGSPFLPGILAARKVVDKILGSLPPTQFALPVGRTMMPVGAMTVQPTELPAPSASPVLAGTAVTGTGTTAANLPASFKSKVRSQRATFTGVGFFDRVHGQTGVAQLNGIELHPILSIKLETA